MNETELASVVGGAVFILCMPLKRYRGFPDAAIPHVAMVLGAVIAGALTGWDGLGLVRGLFYGAAAVGVHQGIKQPQKPKAS